MTRALPFFFVFSLLLLAGCILIPIQEIRLGMTVLVSFLTIAIAVIMLLPWGKDDELEENE